MDQFAVERVDGVALVRINRPEKRNALTLAMLTRLADILELQVAEDVTAIVLTGDDAAFSGGVDLGELGNGANDVSVDDVLAATVTRLRAVPVPLVAAIEGPCVGGAVELALTCDARILADGGFFAVPATKLGLLYRPEGLAGMLAGVGRDTISRLFLFNERLGSDQALAAGLATHTCEKGAAVALALELCSGVSRDSADAVRATKVLVGELLALATNLEHWLSRREALLNSKGRREALARARSARPEER